MATPLEAVPETTKVAARGGQASADDIATAE